MKRDHSIDILRFIGISLLVLAHVSCPFTLRQIRIFDVPLMVFISGLSYGGRGIDSVGSFYWKRLKRILIPVWTFIPIYTIPLVILQETGVLNASFTWHGFWGSFIFYDEAIGYIWIFKVFIIMMFLTPLLIKTNNLIKSDLLFCFVVFWIIVIQQILCNWNATVSNVYFHKIMDIYGLYVFGYVPLYMLGLRVRTVSKSSEKFIFLFFIVLFCFSVAWYFKKEGLPFQLSTYKYPPQYYYIVYGCIMSLLLWLFRAPITKLLDNTCILFIGQNSDWIYLWHAFFVVYVTYFIKLWYLQYIIIYALAIMCCLIQKKLVNRSKYSFFRKYY